MGVNAKIPFFRPRNKAFAKKICDQTQRRETLKKHPSLSAREDAWLVTLFFSEILP